jgi:hypothetical protein
MNWHMRYRVKAPSDKTQFFWALLIMALMGNIIATAFSGNPSIINYDMFAAVFAMLSLFYLIPATLKDSFMIHPIIMIALDVLNTLFFFCGAVATAAKLGVHSCGNPVRSYSKNYIGGLLILPDRIILNIIVLPTARPTPRSAATKPRHQRLSSFSALQHLLSLQSSRLFRERIAV